jgi:23S rRNA (adenine2503-C2)-methyltransferase
MVEDIRNFSVGELEARFKSQGMETYRARQVFGWLYQKKAEDFSLMTNLSGAVREKLGRFYMIDRPVAEKILTSRDLTQKFLFRLSDGAMIESVSIPFKSRLTACLSTQVGCKFSCAFCASGSAGFKRHLTTGEIVGQLVAVLNNTPEGKVSNVVFMGVGEPLDNYDHLLGAIRIINHPLGIHLGIRKMTISTAGLAPAIERLSKEALQLELSVSLHAATDQKRDAIMPVNIRYPLKKLMAAVRVYAAATKRKVTFEYILLGSANTLPEDAQALTKLLHGLDCRVNLIPYNPTASRSAFQMPTKIETLFFKNALQKNGVDVTLRQPRGTDIGAACGQLRINASKKKDIRDEKNP